MRLLPAAVAGILISILLIAPAQAATTLTVKLDPKFSTEVAIRATVTVSGSTASGVLRYFRYSNTSCGGSPQWFNPIGAGNGEHTGPNLQNGQPGDYGLIVQFDATGTINDKTSICHGYLVQRPVTVNAQLTRTTFEAGENVEPQVTLQGNTSDAAGQVEFARWPGPGCGPGKATSAGIRPVVNGQIQGTVSLPDSTLGVRSFRVGYSGDQRNSEATSACLDYTVAARIRGIVYQDTDGNGTHDAGEPGIPGVTVTLKKPQGTATALTSNNGSYEFVVTASGNYTLTQSQPGGFVSTTADELTVAVNLTSVIGQNFGESPTPSFAAKPTATTPEPEASSAAPVAGQSPSEGGFAALRLIALALVVLAALTLLVLVFHARWRREDDWY